MKARIRVTENASNKHDYYDFRVQRNISMPNRLQRLLYTAGIFAPYLFLAAVFNAAARACVNIDIGVAVPRLLYLSIVSGIMSLSGIERAVVLVALALLIYHCLFLWTALNRFTVMDFRAENVPSESDNGPGVFLCTYLLPVASWALDLFVKGIQYLPLILIAGILMFFYFAHSNEVPVSPAYMLLRYHFHTVTSKSGKTYTLMSRRKHYRNSGQIRRVIRLFDNLLIDVT